MRVCFNLWNYLIGAAAIALCLALFVHSCDTYVLQMSPNNRALRSYRCYTLPVLGWRVGHDTVVLERTPLSKFLEQAYPNLFTADDESNWECVTLQEPFCFVSPPARPLYRGLYTDGSNDTFWIDWSVANPSRAVFLWKAVHQCVQERRWDDARLLLDFARYDEPGSPEMFEAGVQSILSLPP
jgi:hypothetical protein